MEQKHSLSWIDKKSGDILTIGPSFKIKVRNSTQGKSYNQRIDSLSCGVTSENHTW